MLMMRNSVSSSVSAFGLPSIRSSQHDVAIDFDESGVGVLDDVRASSCRFVHDDETRSGPA